ncbi:MAG: hypothetical protein AAF799_18320 [Myxococcota bacterium]
MGAGVLALTLGACKTDNPLYMAAEESSGGDEAGGTITSGISGISGGEEVTGRPGEDEGEADSTDPSAGETEGAIDTGDPTDSDSESDSGVAVCESKGYDPVDLDITDEFGLPPSPESVLPGCTGSYYFDGPFWEAGAGGQLRFTHCGEGNCSCEAQPWTVDFHGTYSVPPEFSGCGFVELWPALNDDGDCEWVGMAVTQGFEPVFVINNSLRVPVDAPVQPDLVEDELCDTDVLCSERTPGRYALRLGPTVIFEGEEEEGLLGGQVTYQINNRSSTITEECEQQISWTAEAFFGPDMPPGP